MKSKVGKLRILNFSCFIGLACSVSELLLRLNGTVTLILNGSNRNQTVCITLHALRT